MEKEEIVVEKFRVKLKRFINKTLISLCLLIICLIFIKTNSKAKSFIEKYILNNSFNFSSFNNWYTKSFGTLLKKEDKMVIAKGNEYSFEKYLDGEKTKITDNNVYAFKSGIVIFDGIKEGYNHVIIIQGSDGYDIWYGNIDNSNVSIYDYINEGSIVGTAQNELYLLITKDGQNYSYDEYLK